MIVARTLASAARSCIQRCTITRLYHDYAFSAVLDSTLHTGQ